MVTPSSDKYEGNELELFKHATNWKKYWLSKVSAHLEKPKVLEVGAGMGVNSNLILSNLPGINQLTCIEPDGLLANQIATNIRLEFQNKAHIVCGYLNDIPESDLFDTIVYIDVIEHIENDKQEIQRALEHLKPNGHLIILVPAFQTLYSPFDKAIGHFRRYTKRSLKLAGKSEHSTLVEMYYLDSVGLLASLANKAFLKQSSPTPSQISFWDKVLVPLSKVLDIFVMRSFGKSVVGVWQKH